MLQSDIKSFFSFLKPSNIKGWFDVENVFVNYFWFFTLNGVIQILFPNLNLYNIGFPIVIYMLVWGKFKCKNINIIDLLWIFNIIWILCTWIINDYPHKGYLILKSLTQEIAWMMTYWIARNSTNDYLQKIIANASKPLVITCIIGIYCFFMEPSWYVSRIEETIAYFYNSYTINKESILEQYRLRSIFNSAYPLAYLCSMALVYEFFCLIKNGSSKLYYRYHVLFILLLVATSLLCMMRGPLVCTTIGFFVSYIYSHLYVHEGLTTRKLILIFVILFLLGYSATSFVDLSIIEFMYSKIEDLLGDDNFILHRLYLQSQSFSLLGEGMGKYNAIVFYKFDLPSIPDGEYMKIIAEQGFIGLFITLSMFVIGLLKALWKFKYMYYELCILGMLMICMIGANPLSTYDKHCFLYWMALGQVSRFKEYQTNNNKL